MAEKNLLQIIGEQLNNLRDTKVRDKNNPSYEEGHVTKIVYSNVIYTDPGMGSTMSVMPTYEVEVKFGKGKVISYKTEGEIRNLKVINPQEV